MHLMDDFKDFLESAPSSWHAAQEIGNRLALIDFIPLDEEEKWDLHPGKSYFVRRGGAICAFSLPTSKTMRSIILASHTDSPALKLKPKPEVENENMTLLGVELYGAPMISSWLNRDLGIAGRVVVSDKEGNLEEHLVYIDDAPLVIPQLPIHLDREVNEKGLVLNKQDHLLPIACLKKEKSYLETMIRKRLSFHALLGFDLFLVPLEESRFLGSEGEMIASYRIDNLASAHAAAVALATCQKPAKQTLRIGLFWDHEEIGSDSPEGASSRFFEDVMKRISFCLNMNEEEYLLLKGRSLCVSIDMAQAFNPNYPAKFDPQHKVLLGKGIAIKHHANLKYATTAPTAAIIVSACQKLNIPYQHYVARSDIPSGSTVGPIFATVSGIPTVDIGCPQLSMHSIREVMACSDHNEMCQLLTHLLEENL